MAEQQQQELKLEEISDLNLANMVNGLEGLGWRIEHDAADGRIENEGVDKSLAKLIRKRDEVVEEIKKRTGLTSNEQLRVYIQGKVKEQEQLWDRQWEDLSKEGSVFKISGGGRFTETPTIFETVRAYRPLSGTIGPNEYIMVRIQGETRSGIFRIFNDRDVPKFEKLDVKPMYNRQENRGIIRCDEEIEKRIKLPIAKRKWGDFCLSGSVFSHVGFNETFETYDVLNLPGKEQEKKNEVILARPYNYGAELYEFTRKDLGAMVLVPVEPKYHKKRDFNPFFDYVNLYSEEKI